MSIMKKNETRRKGTAKYHLEELGLPMGITDYELKKALPTRAQLAKCVTDAERQIAATKGV